MMTKMMTHEGYHDYDNEDEINDILRWSIVWSTRLSVNMPPFGNFVHLTLSVSLFLVFSLF